MGIFTTGTGLMAEIAQVYDYYMCAKRGTREVDLDSLTTVYEKD